uniref:Uncharacterized protein n=1 Tax=Podoviridae sp. ctsNK10 TaxID=2826582 RepID=A0A8S5NLP9_9CAUD|nr:MAG TPA: hypothetical protein [Podoviridae sp. ctsNK10]
MGSSWFINVFLRKNHTFINSWIRWSCYWQLGDIRRNSTVSRSYRYVIGL